MARRAVARRAVALLAVGALAWWCAGAEHRAALLRDRWEATAPVLVAIDDLLGAAPLDPALVRLEERPRALVPAGALGELPRDERWVLEPIARGEAVLDRRISRRPGRSDVPAGRAAMEVELLRPSATLRRGDRVDLLAAPAVATASARGDGLPEAVVVAEDAVVLDGGPSEGAGGEGAGGEGTGRDDVGEAGAPVVGVAVREADVTRLAAALLVGPVTVVRRPAR